MEDLIEGAGVIINALDKPVTTKVFGNYLTFAPKKPKLVREHTARWINEYRRGEGLVMADSRLADPEFRASAEGKAIIKEAIEKGIKNRVQKLRELQQNIDSMQRDLDSKNFKVNAKSWASDGEVAAIEELVALQAKKKDEAAERAKKIEELEKSLTGE